MISAQPLFKNLKIGIKSFMDGPLIEEFIFPGKNHHETTQNSYTSALQQLYYFHYLALFTARYKAFGDIFG